MSTATDLFGSTSEGSMRMETWLDVMCRGCKRDRGRSTHGLGGFGCELPIRAYLDPGTADMPEWSPDAMWPDRFSELTPDDPWPVCMLYEPRKQRSDAGIRRGPAAPYGQLELL